MTLFDRYLKAQAFQRPTVIFSREEGWYTCGPGHLWLGCTHKTWQDALREALEGHRREG